MNMGYWKRVEAAINGFITGPGEEVHMGKKHIFLNYDLSEYVDRFEEYNSSICHPHIGQSHRVHLYFITPNECILNDKLADFIRKCDEAGARKVIIHVPTNRPILSKLVKGTVYGLDNCMVIEEDPDKTSFFVNKSDKSSIQNITVGWNMEEETEDESI